MSERRVFDKVAAEAVIDDMWREFCRHRRDLAKPDRAWKLTFEEYVDLWLPHWPQRRRLNLVMCRTGFSGDYQVGNVRIDTRANQLKDQWRAYRKRLGKPEYEDTVESRMRRQTTLAELHEKWRRQKEEAIALIGPYKYKDK